MQMSLLQMLGGSCVYKNPEGRAEKGILHLISIEFSWARSHKPQVRLSYKNILTPTVGLDETLLDALDPCSEMTYHQNANLEQYYKSGQPFW